MAYTQSCAWFTAGDTIRFFSNKLIHMLTLRKYMLKFYQNFQKLIEIFVGD